jgi:hypothetical protein
MERVTKLRKHFCHYSRALVCLIGTLLILSNTVHAELIFSAPPREDAETGKKTYGPLVNYLSYIIGEKVVYEHPDGWAEYANNMRDGHYDIVFDGPHFSAWRMKHISHSPVARLPGSLGFVVVVRKDQGRVHKIRDLLSVKVCALTSPNLGTVTFYNILNNPVYQPRIYEVKGGFKRVYQAFKDGKCEAAILRDSFYYKMDPREKDHLLLVTATNPVPNQTITVSPRLQNKKRMIAQKLVSVEGQKAAANLIKRFSDRQDKLLIANRQEFINLDGLLTGVVWGW